ncbi:acyltransferase [Marinobacterium aestuariivivens]|uniref:Acyltransferase n=1 Tax=Marinobacterium aestuariivivens TaxID=1698799 RepID=A0ABW1ZWZ7_9GAMM
MTLIMPYYSEEELLDFGFKSLGKNVKVSCKASVYDAEKIEIGDNSRVDDFCVISGEVSIGRYCHVTPMCILAGGMPGIKISDFCTFAYGVKIFSQSDDYSGETLTNSLIPSKYKREIFKSVCIEKYVIIGAGAVVFPGVKVAEGCAIGAMTLLNKSTQPWGVYVGIPARRVKVRKKIC